MDVLWKLEPATATKHRLYQRYLDAWWPILLQTSQRMGFARPRVTLLDAFAGRYEDGEPGSPVFILDRLLHHGAVARMNSARSVSIWSSSRSAGTGMSTWPPNSHPTSAR